MTQMIVRPPQLWVNPFGDLAEQYSVYIGKPFQDPTQQSSQLTVKDGRGVDANIVMQPIIVTDGITRNSSGQQITPVIDTQNYSMLYVSSNGVKFYSESSFFGDGLSTTTEGGALAEEVFDNLQQALASDLTGFNYIFVQSEFIGWQGTSEGPTVNSLYYYTGGTGAPGTGDVFAFYDNAGNEWKLAKSVAEQVNEAGIATNTQAIADNAAQIATNSSDITDNAAASATAQAAANAAQQTADSASLLYQNAVTTQVSNQGTGVIYTETRNFPAFKFEGQFEITNASGADIQARFELETQSGVSGKYTLSGSNNSGGLRFDSGNSINTGGVNLGLQRLPSLNDSFSFNFSGVISNPNGVNLEFVLSGVGTDTDGSLTVTPIAAF